MKLDEREVRVEFRELKGRSGDEYDQDTFDGNLKW